MGSELDLESVPQTNNKKLGFWAQVALIFFTVSGGAYGLEALVGAVGPFLAVALVITVPIFWAVPVALMVSELASAMPEEGGYYVWVKKGLGSFWGFQEGWWTLCYSAVDMALYPVFFVTYLSFFFPILNAQSFDMQVVRVAISVAFVALGLLFNLRGSLAVGMNAIANLLLVSFPFLLMTFWALFKGDWAQLFEAITVPAPANVNPANLAAGLAIILWNYCGWDNVSTYAAEVEDPQKNYPRALGAALLIIMISYVLPLLAGFKVAINPLEWSGSSGWPAIAEKLGGHWLGVLGAVAALLSAWALFNSQLLYVSRLPSAMAKDGWLPKVFAKISPKSGSPVVALVVISIVAACFSALSLKKLIVVDILFYTLGLSLEFLALIALRIKHPEMARPFKIPLPTWGLVFLSVPPILLAAAVAFFSTLGETGSFEQVGLVAFGILAGLLVYFYRRQQATAIQNALVRNPSSD